MFEKDQIIRENEGPHPSSMETSLKQVPPDKHSAETLLSPQEFSLGAWLAYTVHHKAVRFCCGSRRQEVIFGTRVMGGGGTTFS